VQRKSSMRRDGSEVGGDPVVQVQPSVTTAADHTCCFSCYMVPQAVLRPELSIPLINYFVSILATVMALIVQSWRIMSQLRNDESAGAKKKRKNVHMMDRKRPAPTPPENFEKPSSCLRSSVLKLSLIIHHLSVYILYLTRTYDCLTSWF
jgi:hypothetical protein